MLNSTTLDQLSEYFRWICIVHLSQTRSELVDATEKSLIEAVRERPETLAGIKKIVNGSIVFDRDLGATVFDIVDDLKETQEEMSNDLDDSILAKQPIKHSSPFTRHFDQIKQHVEKDVEPNANLSSVEEPNVHYNPSYVDHLLDKFMPYCFIWSGFVFKGMHLTRLTNGTVENFNKFVKSTSKGRVLPHRHMASQLEFIAGMCDEYLNALKNPCVQFKKIPKIQEILDESDEEDFHEAEEHYNKMLPPVALGYQSKINLGNLKITFKC